MELLFWFLDSFPKALVVLVFLYVIIVMLESSSAPSTEEKESLDGQKNGVEKAKLGNNRLKASGAKKSKKKKRVKFADDVVAGKVDNFEGHEKPIKDSELCENMSENGGLLDKSLDGGLVIERGEGSKTTEEVDDVVVPIKVDDFEGPNKPIEVFELSEDMSEKVGFWDELLEEGLDVQRGEGGTIVKEVYQFQGQRVDKEPKLKVMLSAYKLAEECGDVSMIKAVKGADAEGKGCKNVGLLVEASDGKLVEEKNEGTIIGDYCGLKGADVVTSGLEGFVVEQEIKIDAVGGEDGLISMTDDVGVEECNAAAEERVPNHAEIFEKELETKGLDGEKELRFVNDDVAIDESNAATIERVADNAEVLETVDAENGMVLMNDNVATDESDTVFGKRVGKNGDTRDEQLEKEAVDCENGSKLMNGVVQIDEVDAAAGGRVASNAEVLEEVLEREAVEEKSKDTAGDIDKICGGEGGNIYIVSGSLENLVVTEVTKNEEFGSGNKVELDSDNVAYPQIEEGGVESVNVDDMIGPEEGLSAVNEGEEGILRDKNVGNNGDDDDDDWEGVERSELEKVFAEAVNYVEYGRKKRDDQPASLSDVQMLLYGLHKLVVEGPCHVPQPMALKVSARAKW